ncbi:helix-turn-helix domain-containing protein [Mangrovimicrobium sediminis]|uniref:helix-turn-helix domain-containing protein n=1 Tax=Mangrovimicrobium sediminis TaxID=2562682 RepID=UPI00197E1034|nr:helix-turn-helix domain-containing protein [Haliea sp. SAOS-164]
MSKEIAAVRRRGGLRPPRQLVENRTLYESHSAELSIYDTYAAAERVRLDAEELLYCGMLSGRKVLHGQGLADAPFTPHESFVMAPGESVDIDFPEATANNPTTCLTLGISRERLRLECERLNRQHPAPGLLGEWSPRPEQVLHLYHTEATQQLLARIVSCFLSDDSERDLVLDLGVTELVTRMLRRQGRDFIRRCAALDPTADALAQVIAHIEQHLGEAIEVGELCRIACMSRSKFYQQFSDALGVSPMEYIQQRRLERARELIAAGNGVTRTCYEVGYSNPSHFSRRFQQQYGVSPSAYAQRGLERAAVASEPAAH